MTKDIKIENAFNVLKDAGYYVDVLWSIYDVKSIHPCTDEEAYRILDEVMASPSVMESIADEILKKSQK
jgi:hypothetical protein